MKWYMHKYKRPFPAALNRMYTAQFSGQYSKETKIVLSSAKKSISVSKSNGKSTLDRQV